QVFAVGPPEGGDGDLEIAVLKLLDVLHAALPVAALADDQGPLMILKAGGDNLAAAGAVPVNKADHREVQITTFMVADIGFLVTDARPDRDDQAVVDEQVGHVDGATQ